MRPKFSLRSLLLVVALVGAYLASWDATQTYGVVAGTPQRSPMPFIILEDGIPHFKRGASLVLDQERKYYVWFFGDPHALFVREMHREWSGHSQREQTLLMKQVAWARRERIERSSAAR